MPYDGLPPKSKYPRSGWDGLVLIVKVGIRIGFVALLFSLILWSVNVAIRQAVNLMTTIAEM